MWGLMRKLAIGAAVSGALALTGLAAPAALADSPDLTFGAITVNSGKPIVVGTKAAVTVPVTYSVTRPTAFKVDYKNNFLGIALYRGRLAEPDNAIEGSPKKPVCTPTATTDTTVTESCATKLTIDPRDSLFEGADATTWKAAAFYSEQAIDEDDSDDHISFHLGSDIWGNLGTAKLQRLAKATVNATPEPVVKGKTLTVKGTLTRADWDAPLRGLQGPEGDAPVQGQGRHRLHGREDGDLRHGRRPVHHREGVEGRLVPLQVRRYVHHRGEDVRGGLRRREVT